MQCYPGDEVMAKKKSKAKMVAAKPADFYRFYLQVSEGTAAPKQLPGLIARRVFDRVA